VQNRNYWKTCPFPYDKAQDLVLSFDFAVVRAVTIQGGTARYLDHLVKSDLMEHYNHETYHFFANWFLDKDHEDIFVYRGITISNALRLYIWNDITYAAHILINLLALKHIRHGRLLVGIEDVHVTDMLGLLDLKKETWTIEPGDQLPEYYFPIFRWMHEQVHPSPLMRLAKIVVSGLLAMVTNIGGRLHILKNGTHNVFVQPYHPTIDIIKRLNLDDNINVVLENPTDIKEIVYEKFIPQGWTASRHRRSAESMISAFHARKVAQWTIEGINIGNYLYPRILEQTAKVLPECLKRIEEIITFFSKRRLSLMITTTNLGMTNCLTLNYCHKNGIPSYLIINGYMTGSYLDESKNANWINSYGSSIKDDYFAGMENIVCLGDPRMDAYAAGLARNSSTDNPTIVIGAGGYSNIDLDSYVAVEFDFLNDILTACGTLIRNGRKMNIIVKVRPNGYIEQYSNFIREYHADLPVTLYDQKPMKLILSQADLYISIYSGTLFEAASLGIPTLYYKTDEITSPPFDGRSELVTALTPDDLIRKIELFYERDSMYEVLNDKKVLEKYVGPLDGRNVERNLDFIYSLLDFTLNKEARAS
jgi:hypothetical protein